MKKQHISMLLAISVLLTGCAGTWELSAESTKDTTESSQVENQPVNELSYRVTPETFALELVLEGKSFSISDPTGNYRVEQFEQAGNTTSWTYPDQDIDVTVKPVNDYLEVCLTASDSGDQSFTWPAIGEGEQYYLPLGEGKRIPRSDDIWAEYLTGTELSVISNLSMPFFANDLGDYAIVYIMENPLRSSLTFTNQNGIEMRLIHDYPQIDPVRDQKFRIYRTDATPAAIAKIYKNYVMEQRGIVTLEEKAERNSNIRKLYGAPHIYFWGDRAIAPESINWNAFRAAPEAIMQHLISTVASSEEAAEFRAVLDDLSRQDYVDQYQKDKICQLITQAVKADHFYDEELFPIVSDPMKSLLQKETLNEMETIQRNKLALSANLPDVFTGIDNWGASFTTDILREMRDAGIDKAWIGLDNWENAFVNPELVTTANELGYLIGSYDSYHSIHEPGREEWNTAAFEDSSLYESATITNSDGKKETGFKGVGRKLNPTLTMPAVKQRVGQILSTELPFNSWFVDCDATGEIFDDYSPEHQTTIQQDYEARLERMRYISTEKHMVVGSEGGNDFAAPVIAFAHGIELPSFSWMDEDMKSNKDSDYYIGKYYSASGGVPEHFKKQIPVKESYRHIFLDNAFDVPLYRLVYNNSVITSYHWDWSTFKIQGEVENRMLREILYNVPPLYHLDQEEWYRKKEDIISHTKIWSEFAQNVITEEMTGFEYLTEDGLVQMTSYGDQITVTANFSNEAFPTGDTVLEPKSLMIIDGGEVTVYCPQVNS